ncbi:MAG TPA: HlyD family efflux transporter periplasmic adaptor subunit [Gemmataceae bacterium]|nr:HlyD family efflux transporter periplasmic adaptor subunit [Gemmataceae bacterium]
MTRSERSRRHSRFRQGAALVVLAFVSGCTRPENGRLQGYVEGEFVYVASPHAAELKSLYVERGSAVKPGDPLFALDATPEQNARDEAAKRVLQARASLEDALKGKRPTEIASIEAQLKQARAALEYSEVQLKRQEHLTGSLATTADDLARARAVRDQDRARVSQLEADLETARLGARSDQIAAAEANLRALEAALAKAEWDLAQQARSASQAGIVFDTLYRPGEWVAAGRPVVALLPPENIKVRAFVPEDRIGSVHLGDPVRVSIDGTSGPVAGKVSFISPRAEFTPPVIYSRETRSKLVFMIEIVFDRETAAKLHPGQPVDVELGP